MLHLNWFVVSLGMFVLAFAAQVLPAEAAVETWPAPAGERLYEDYAVRVNGKPVSVYECRVSAVPYNQVWPGYQRPIDQTELAGFATWGMSGPVTVEVTAKRPFSSVAVRPTSRGIKPVVKGQTITFRLAKPGQLTVEFDGYHHALHLFANPPAEKAPKAGPDVLVFGPGVHRPGKLQLKSGQTVYVAGGAVVHTAIDARQATGVRILGRGIIDTSEYERDKGGGCIRLSDCSDVKIEGVILRDSDVWTLAAFGCRNVSISNVKLIGLWRYNADGIDICNSQDVTLHDSFIRSFDDGVVIKGLNWGPTGYHERPDRGIRVSNMVVWCDWGKALEIGAETSAPEIHDIEFRDIDIIRTTHIAIDIQAGDRADIHDIRYEDIRVEIDDRTPLPRMQGSREEKYAEDMTNQSFPILIAIVIDRNNYSQDKERGRVRDVNLRNVTVLGTRKPPSFVRGLDAEHTVNGVTIQGLRIGGRIVATAEEAHLSVGPFAAGVVFTAGAK